MWFLLYGFSRRGLIHQAHILIIQIIYLMQRRKKQDLTPSILTKLKKRKIFIIIFSKIMYYSKEKKRGVEGWMK